MKPKTNVLEHELVPKHTILSPEEREKLLKEFKIKKAKQLPTIKSSDPVIQMLEGKHGDIVRIERKSSIAEGTMYYRLVVDD